MKNNIAIFFAGLIFALGLGISGMTQPAKVVGFLDVTGSWDPSLAFVMVGAIGVHMVAYRLVPRMTSPIFAAEFGVPTRSDVNGRLLGGAVLFGLGWGLGGFCPGPALVSLASGASTVLMFVGGMLGGMTLMNIIDRQIASKNQKIERQAS
ncbi:MAG: putative membrane protein YedE/YeeE [Myxococcota bacterium]|jgi:uncharacterized membrane protein YedE/YeeE